jgi:release factor glutamine methyltransferase
MEEATGSNPLGLLTGSDRQLGPDVAARLEKYAARRLGGEPVSRILGRSGFFGLDLVIGPDVLDPRADTETLVNVALAKLNSTERTSPLILDLGTGSGAILSALLDARGDAFGVGVDISPKACVQARQNLARCGLSERSSVVCGDWTGALQGQFDLIVSNPPYISWSELGALDREVVAFDPILALNGGPDGLDPYRSIAPELTRLLRSGGAACFEIGWRQAADVTQILKSAGFGETRISTDHAGRDRVVAVDAP